MAYSVPEVVNTGTDVSFYLEITLGDMAEEDAFKIALPLFYARFSVGELIGNVFPDKSDRQAHIRAYFDLRENPDLPEMYEVLLEVFTAWRRGRCALSFYVRSVSGNQRIQEVGAHEYPEQYFAPDRRASDPMCLIVNQHFTPVEYAVQNGYSTGRTELMSQLQSDTLLYSIGYRGLILETAPISKSDRNLLSVAEILFRKNLLTISESDRTYELSEDGAQLLTNMIAEAEFYGERYDVFRDVLLDFDSGEPIFGSGHGRDLRVVIYESEGINPIRTVFLIRLHINWVNDFGHRWGESIVDEIFLEELLVPVVDREEITEGSVENVLESGFDELIENGVELISRDV